MTISVVSSQIASDIEQIDGRRAVIERHVLSDGRKTDISYLAESGDDVQLKLSERVAELNAYFIELEAANATVEGGE